ncbi:MAG TPA: hypothetical protein VHW94_09410 [Candidatus Dormibacteraeota bacterium]|nr:hypothetical protein [Candidatus Dormibacteraeota bacterium]
MESRGAEPPVAGAAPPSVDGVKMQILSTEHWSLLATRSLGYTDSFGRANMFFAVLSGAVIALALIAQGGHFNTTFYITAILLLATVYFVGMATIARIGHLNAEDAQWLRGMNRIRHAYLELRPELDRYFVTGQYDDMRGVLTTLGLKAAPPGQHLLSDLGHGVQTLPGMLGIVVSVVGGAWGAVVAIALGAPDYAAIATGAICFLLTVGALAITARRAIVTSAQTWKPNFPSPE